MRQDDLELLAPLLYTTPSTVRIWADFYGDDVVRRAVKIMVGDHDAEGALWYAEQRWAIRDAEERGDRAERSSLCERLAWFADRTMAFLAECDKQRALSCTR